MNLRWRTLFLLAVVAAVLWVGYLARAVVTPLVGAVLLAYVLDPVVRRMQRLGLSRNAASAALVAAVLLLVLGSAGWGGARVVTETQRFYSDVVGEPATERSGADALAELGMQAGDEAKLVPGTWHGRAIRYVDVDGDGKFRPGLARVARAKVEDALAASPWTSKLAEQLGEASGVGTQLASSAGQWVTSAVEQGRAAGSAFLSVLTLLFLFPIYLYYSLARLPALFDVTIAHLPHAQRARVVEILGKIHATLAAFFRGRLILLVLRLVFLLIAYIGFGTPFALVCAVFGALTSLVPVVGSVASISMALAMQAAAGSGAGTLLLLFGVLAAFEAVEQYVLTPVFVGRSVGLHPLTILVATFIAGDLLGLFGMLVAIPLAAVLKILAQEFVLPEIRRHAGIAPSAESAPSVAGAPGTSAENLSDTTGNDGTPPTA
ncbi:MAG: hypothetical protein HMLKMBBP_00052 [Planctomycetes bacterium]|nr:hypothetical protein [Planctomycetota bacterium]